LFTALGASKNGLSLLCIACVFGSFVIIFILAGGPFTFQPFELTLMLLHTFAQLLFHFGVVLLFERGVLQQIVEVWGIVILSLVAIAVSVVTLVIACIVVIIAFISEEL